MYLLSNMVGSGVSVSVMVCDRYVYVSVGPVPMC